MTEEENLLVRIKFIIDMYNSGADTADNALERIFDLVDNYEKEVMK